MPRRSTARIRRPLSLRLLRWVMLPLVVALASPATAQQFLPVDPVRTYLRTAQDPNARDVIPIDLASLQAGPGCILELERIGEFEFSDGPDTLSQLIVAFSDGSVLLPNPLESDTSCYNRIPGVLDAGMPPIVTIPTNRGGLCTDIPFDFGVDGIVQVQVPDGATHLFVCAHDEYYGDNRDDDGDYGLLVTNLTPTVVITQDTYISDTDFSIDGAKLFVIGATLTIDGEHDFQSISVTDGGVITHSAGFENDDLRGLRLHIVEDVLVDAGSSIDVSSRGYPGDEGPGAGLAGPNYGGGGGHGGEGGRGANGSASDGGISYGSITEPLDFGSGGGSDIDNPTAGRSGGGAIRLDIGGTLTVAGRIDANGQGWRSWNASPGAGAGGSIWITAGTVEGTTGEIRALGGISLWGNGADNDGGGGAGGRIAVYADSITLGAERFRCHGGGGWSSGPWGGDGAAGTIYLAETGSRARLIIDNNDVRSDPRLTTLRGPLVLDADVIVRNSARFGPPQDMAFEASFAGDVLVGIGAAITASERGYLGDEGPGAGLAGPNYGGGGGHGGEGGRGANGSASEGGISYGSITEPVDFGSGGGSDIDHPTAGRSGGGAIRLDIGGTLTVAGRIDANGQGWAWDQSPGAGAGGSIWITAGTVEGTTGEIRAAGGSSLNRNGNDQSSGGGAGGRIAVYANSITLGAERFRCHGGGGWSSGPWGGDAAAGTIYLAETGSRARLIIDNNNVRTDPRLTTLRGPLVLDADVIVRNSARFGPPQDMAFEASFAGDVLVGIGAAITASERGYLGDEGPGAGLAGPNYGGGGGHGGEGGRGANGSASEGGISYGSITEPLDFGSGGGSDIDNPTAGRSGGGAIRLDIGGTLTVAGRIDANGQGWRSWNADPGAGAGGSIWITAGTVEGTTGEIRAQGGSSWRGDGYDGNGGGGAGGRIAVYADSITLGAERFRCHGGGGWSSGPWGGDAAAGTIYLAETGSRARLIIDNNNVRTDPRLTMLPVDVLIDADILVRQSGRLGVELGQNEAYWHVLGDLVVEPGSDIYVGERGFPRNEGPGAGQQGLSFGGGGGHGGKGGDGRSDDPFALGGDPYGSAEMPVTWGSGGASDPNTGAGGGSGGNSIWIRVEGELSLRGNIDARGGNGAANEAGGGAGGSILIEAGSIEGIAVFRAPGGDGNSVGGGGGGGRIAVYSCDIDPRIQYSVVGGNGGQRGADGTLVVQGIGIGMNPEDLEVNLGETAEFSVLALGTGVTYQWTLDGQPLADGQTGHGSIIEGAATSRLTIRDVQPEDFGQYAVELSNACGALASENATLAQECRADINGDGVVDSRDVTAFLNLWTAGDPEADFNDDGNVDTLDMLAFLNAWSAGC